MEFLIGLAVACGLLYFWLLGRWFARVLAFLLLAAFVVLLAKNADAVEFCVSLAVMWLLSGIPIYIRRLNRWAKEPAGVARGS